VPYFFFEDFFADFLAFFFAGIGRSPPPGH
jgi:hypothetical protein